MNGVISGDDSWGIPYDPDIEQHSLWWKPPGSPLQKNEDEKSKQL
jgi:hypothetical protein